MIPRPLESAATAAAGGALAAAVGLPFGTSIPFAAIGALNGAIGGWRGTYGWHRLQGCAAFVLDSTWALVGTTAGLLAHVVAVVRRRPGYVTELSVRQDRHVYLRGFQVRPGFAVTVGNVVSGVRDVSTPSRRRLVTDHEDVHVWQSRVFGPAYLPLYLAWLALGAGYGCVVWAARHRRQPFARVVESCAYYSNPFEWWAYSRDGQWRPRRMATGVGWRRPAARSLAAKRGARELARGPSGR